MHQMDLCRYFPSLAGPFGSLVFLEGRILGGDHSKGSAGYRDTHPISFGCPSLSLMKQLPGPTVGWTTTFVPSTHCPGAMPPAPVRWDVLKCCGLVPGTPWLNSPWGVTFHLQKKKQSIHFLFENQPIASDRGRSHQQLRSRILSIFREISCEFGARWPTPAPLGRLG